MSNSKGSRSAPAPKRPNASRHALENSAPDLELLGDQVTFQPRGYVEPFERDGDKERNLVEHMARFRASPLE